MKKEQSGLSRSRRDSCGAVFQEDKRANLGSSLVQWRVGYHGAVVHIPHSTGDKTQFAYRAVRISWSNGVFKNRKIGGKPPPWKKSWSWSASRGNNSAVLPKPRKKPEKLVKQSVFKKRQRWCSPPTKGVKKHQLHMELSSLVVQRHSVLIGNFWSNDRNFAGAVPSLVPQNFPLCNSLTNLTKSNKLPNLWSATTSEASSSRYNSETSETSESCE